MLIESRCVPKYSPLTASIYVPTNLVSTSALLTTTFEGKHKLTTICLSFIKSSIHDNDILYALDLPDRPS